MWRVNSITSFQGLVNKDLDELVLAGYMKQWY